MHFFSDSSCLLETCAARGGLCVRILLCPGTRARESQANGTLGAQTVTTSPGPCCQLEPSGAEGLKVFTWEPPDLDPEWREAPEAGVVIEKFQIRA